MRKITVLFAANVAIYAMTLQTACVETAHTAGTQCAKPILIPSDARHATRTITVRIKTATAGAYIRYTLDDSTPTSGSSGNGTEIPAASGNVSLPLGPKEKTLKAIAYKTGLIDSSIAEASYVYDSPY